MDIFAIRQMGDGLSLLIPDIPMVVREDEAIGG